MMAEFISSNIYIYIINNYRLYTRYYTTYLLDITLNFFPMYDTCYVTCYCIVNPIQTSSEGLLEDINPLLSQG